jgi:hypothetical protein
MAQHRIMFIDPIPSFMPTERRIFEFRVIEESTRSRELFFVGKGPSQSTTLRYEVGSSWPKPLLKNWVTGHVIGVSMDVQE